MDFRRGLSYLGGNLYNICGLLEFFISGDVYLGACVVFGMYTQTYDFMILTKVRSYFGENQEKHIRQ